MEVVGEVFACMFLRCLQPSWHMAFIQRHYNVDATWYCIDAMRRCVNMYVYVASTLKRHCINVYFNNVASTLMWCCLNVMCPLGGYPYVFVHHTIYAILEANRILARMKYSHSKDSDQTVCPLNDWFGPHGSWNALKSETIIQCVHWNAYFLRPVWENCVGRLIRVSLTL